MEERIREGENDASQQVKIEKLSKEKNGLEKNISSLKMECDNLTQKKNKLEEEKENLSENVSANNKQVEEISSTK